MSRHQQQTHKSHTIMYCPPARGATLEHDSLAGYREGAAAPDWAGACGKPAPGVALGDGASRRAAFAATGGAAASRGGRERSGGPPCPSRSLASALARAACALAARRSWRTRSSVRCQFRTVGCAATSASLSPRASSTSISALACRRTLPALSAQDCFAAPLRSACGPGRGQHAQKARGGPRGAAPWWTWACSS